MFIRRLEVSYPNESMAGEVFRLVVADVWTDGSVEVGQDMSNFFAAVQEHIEGRDWVEGQEMHFIRFGERYILYHSNGSSIQIDGKEITVEFTKIKPRLDQETLSLLQRL